MATIQFPIIFCAGYPSCEPITIEPPFGLPPKTFRDPCCAGIDALMVDFSDLLAPIYPFLTIVDCLVKLIDIVTAIPESIGPPPDITKLAELGNKVADFLPCVGKITALAPLPVNIVAFARFIRGLMQLLIALLECFRRAFTVYIDLVADVYQLSGSPDDYLRQMGICLGEQANTMRGQLGLLLQSLLNVFTLLNTVLGIMLEAVPPLKDYLEEEGLYPIDPNIDVSVDPNQVADLSWIDTIVTVLSAIEVVANIAAGGT